MGFVDGVAMCSGLLEWERVLRSLASLKASLKVLPMGLHSSWLVVRLL